MNFRGEMYFSDFEYLPPYKDKLYGRYTHKRGRRVCMGRGKWL